MDTTIVTPPVTGFPLPPADLESLGYRRGQPDRLVALIHDIEEGRRPQAWATLDLLVAA